MMTVIRKGSLVLVAVAILLWGASAFAEGGQDDSVLSQHIKEADGTSGQDTNSGSGMKTGHIQDGAVTDAKITGPISASKISSAGLNADTVDGLHASELAPASHNHDAVYQKKYAKVAVVAQGGGDYADPVSAMSDISSWCGTPSATNPCLLKIMPGIYNIGGNTLSLAEFVDLEGSGVNSTTLFGNPATNFGGLNTVVMSTGNSEIRSLTIENGGGVSGDSQALHFTGSTLCAINNVRLVSNGGSYNNAAGLQMDSCSYSTIKNLEVILEGNANKFGVYLAGGGGPAIFDNVSVAGANRAFLNQYWHDVTINNLTAVVDVTYYYNFCSAVWNWGSEADLTIKNSVLTSSRDAILMYGGTLSVYQSIISAPTAIRSDGSGEWGSGAARVIMSQMDGGVDLTYGGTVDCLYSYTSALAPAVCN